MPHLIGRREVGRRYDLETGELVIVEDVDWHRWNADPGQFFTCREETRVKLAPGELEHVRQLAERRIEA